jgi:hypothetical protein
MLPGQALLPLFSRSQGSSLINYCISIVIPDLAYFIGICIYKWVKVDILLNKNFGQVYSLEIFISCTHPHRPPSYHETASIEIPSGLDGPVSLRIFQPLPPYNLELSLFLC